MVVLIKQVVAYNLPRQAVLCRYNLDREAALEFQALGLVELQIQMEQVLHV